MKTPPIKSRKRSIVRFRHKVVYMLCKPLLRIYVWAAYAYKAQKHRFASKEPCIILANHNCNFDPIFMALSFNFPIYFVASDQIFRLGWVSSLLKYLVAPIPILKAKVDTETIRTMISTARAGGSIGLFPEGNRSYNGATGYIPPSTAKLLKMMGVRTVLYKIEGGYLSTPRWADHERKGKMSGHVVRTLSKEDLAALSVDEINKILNETLYENAYDTQAKHPVAYKGKDLAQSLERVLFLCPACYGLATACSGKDTYTCSCGYSVRCNEFGSFESNGSSEKPIFSDVLEWDSWQREMVAEMVLRDDPLVYPTAKPLFFDEQESLYLCSKGKKRDLIGTGRLSFYPDRLEFACVGETRVFSLCDIAKMNIWGTQTIQFSTLADTVYELNSPLARSGYKYMAMFNVFEQKRTGRNYGFFGI